ncbi:MAG: AsmA family protein [Desulfohalobiaceae bacterium]
MSQKGFPWKWILAGLAGLLVLIVVAAYAIVATYDFNNLKPRIEQAVLDATGRQLNMQGDIELDFGLSPSLVVQEVSLENAPWASQKPMAEMERFELQVALWPLLKGQVEIKRLILVRPRFLVEKDAEDRFNFQMQKPAQESDSQQEQAAKDTSQQQEGQADLSLPQLTVYNMRIQEASLVYQDLQSQESMDVLLQELELSTDSPQSDISLKLQGEYEDYQFSGQGKVGSIQSLLHEDQLWELDLALQALGMELDVSGGIQDVLAQKDLDLDVSARGKDLSPLQEMLGQGLRLQDPLRLSANIQDTGAQAYQASSLDLRLGESDLEGSLDLDLSGAKPELKADLDSKLLDVAALLPAEKDQAKQDKKKEKDQGEASSQGGSGSKRVFSDQPINAEFLDLANASLQLSVDQMLLPALAMQDIQMQAELRNGNLRLKPLQAKVGQGDLDADLGLSSSQSGLELGLRTDIAGLHLSKMLEQLNTEFTMQGQMDAQLEVRGSGASVADIMAGLDGEAGLALGQGSLKNKYISALGGDLKQSLLRLLNPGEEKERILINCFITQIEINKGLADIQALLLDTDLMTVKGKGGVDLGTEELDISLDPDPKQGQLGKLSGKIGFSLGELANPFKLGGTLAQPKMVLDPGRTLLSIGKGVGGGLLLGPAGAAAGILAGDTAQTDACVQVLEEVQEEQKDSGQKPQESELMDKGRKELEKGADKLKEGMNKLFGD